MCELFATGSLVVICCCVLVCARWLLGDHELLTWLRQIAPLAARLAILVWSGLTAALMAARLSHGWLLGRLAGARLSNWRKHRTMRFALYASLWDFATSPAVFLVFPLGRGIKTVIRHAVHTPTLATESFMSTWFLIQGDELRSIRRRSMLGSLTAALCVLALWFGLSLWVL